MFDQRAPPQYHEPLHSSSSQLTLSIWGQPNTPASSCELVVAWMWFICVTSESTQYPSAIKLSPASIADSKLPTSGAEPLYPAELPRALTSLFAVLVVTRDPRKCPVISAAGNLKKCILLVVCVLRESSKFQTQDTGLGARNSSSNGHIESASPSAPDSPRRTAGNRLATSGRVSRVVHSSLCTCQVMFRVLVSGFRGRLAVVSFHLLST